MKKLTLMTIMLAAAVACNKPGPDPTPTPGPDIPEEPKAVDLSAEAGTANSYIVTEEGLYSIPATVKGNGKGCEGLDAPEALKPAGAKLVWQSNAEMMGPVEFDAENGTIEFEINMAGNALIAALDEEENIIWSWHIWFPEEEIGTIDSPSGAKLMNINLGAMTASTTDVSSYGLLYQWGRKDPLPGTPVKINGTTETVPVPVYDDEGKTVTIGYTSWTSTDSNNIAYSIANPTMCISNYKQYASTRDWLVPEESNSSLWGNPYGMTREDGVYVETGSKTFYDPCPAGWRVPDIQTYQHLTPSGGYDEDIEGCAVSGDWNTGWTFTFADGQESYFPAAARYDGSYAMLYGSVSGLWGNYWTNTASSGSNGLAEALAFQQKSISPLASGSRADAYSVRCIKE